MTTPGFIAARELSALLEKYNTERLFIVSGKDSYVNSGAASSIAAVTSNTKIFRFSEFITNPDIKDLERGTSQFREFKPDMIIAIGGGSVIDMAKLIVSTASTINSDAQGILRADEIHKNVPLVAIPTTAGSGSEATQFAVLYINGVKHSVDAPALLPDHAILDPSLTQAMPAYQAAISGIDALCQAVESYWSINSTDESREYSEKAINLILSNIDTSVNDALPEARKKMLEAANYAGKAINIARTTAPHAMSYILTNKYGIPHGQAVALTMASVFSINLDYANRELNEQRGQAYLEQVMNSLAAMFGSSTATEFTEKFTMILSSIKLASSLSQLGINSNDAAEQVASNVNSNRLKNNPVVITKNDIRSIIMALH